MINYVLKKNGKYLAFKSFDMDADFLDECSSEVVQMGYYWEKDFEKAKIFATKRDVDDFLRRKKGEFWQGVEIGRD